MKPNGYELWRGPSELDGSQIVVIATGFRAKSDNVKTGGMIQTYILRTDRSPVVAVQTNADAAICGNCPHRGIGVGRQRTCYVNVGQGPQAVWKAWRAGSYPVADKGASLFHGRKVRLGAYGDPGAVPGWVWSMVTFHAAGWTGYTHQWRNRPDLKPWCMASADTISEAQEAQAAGWRTFRVSYPTELARIDAEVLCPASAQAGKRLQCHDCMACSGGNRRGSVMIPAHGNSAVMYAVRKRAIGLEVEVA